MTCPTCGQHMPDLAPPSWSVTLPRRLRSLNEHSPNANTQRQQYRREREAWQFAVTMAMRLKSIPRAQERRRIVITRIIGSRERAYDYDNLVGGAKALVDAMTRAGLVVDDAARWLDAEYCQERVAGAFGVRLDVWDARRAA